MNTRRVLFSAVFCASLVLLACLGAGEALSRPATHSIGDPPPGLHALPVTFSTADREPVAGWFIRGTEHRGAMLLLHGVRSDRRAMVERARLLGRTGYSVLLIDLPAHGESGGARITFGLREGAGVRAALGFLRGQLPGEPVGVIGVAASLVLSKATPPPDAVVLESMYPTIAEAVTDRLTRRLGSAGRAIAPLLLWQLPLRLGITADELRPVADMPSLHAPVLVMSGTLDRHTTLAESRRIFEAAAEPKEFWAVEGAAHVDLFTHAPQPAPGRPKAAEYPLGGAAPVPRCRVPTDPSLRFHGTAVPGPAPPPPHGTPMNADTPDPMDDHDDADDAPSPEEWALMRQASAAEAAAVDELVLGHCTDRWQKVAMVVGASLDDYDARFSHLPYVYMQVRMHHLVEQGRIERQGDVMALRTAEIRLKDAGRHA